MARRDQEEPFFQRLAMYMAQHDKEIYEAATMLELGLTATECDRVAKNRLFQKMLRAERTRIYNELARDPERGKDTLVGKAEYAIEKLLEAKQYDKALTGILSLAKIEGYVGADTNVNVFSGLSTQDMLALKERLKKKDGETIPPAQGSA